MRGEAAGDAEAGVSDQLLPLVLLEDAVVAEAFFACRRASSEGSECGEELSLSEAATAETGLTVSFGDGAETAAAAAGLATSIAIDSGECKAARRSVSRRMERRGRDRSAAHARHVAGAQRHFCVASNS